jgi:uncharacterized repeat protein (TIGR03803 family)
MTCKRYSQSAVGLLSFFVAVFALTVPASAEWKEKVLYSFQGSPDGSFPGGGLVFDKAGNLYGVTLEGGSGSCPPAQCGIVYQLSPPTQKGGPWTETVLYVFKGQHYGDGSSPAGTLLIDSSGNLYGATGYGGTGQCMIFGGVVGCGTVYELSRPKKQGEAWTEKVLYSFKGDKDGQLAGESLTFDAQGNIYGATAYGGGYGSCNEPYYQHCGTIYELSPPKTKGGKWTEKVLYGFKGVKSGQQSGDGANPNGGLVLDSKGGIYGTTYFGGNNVKGECEGGVGGTGCGIVFKLQPPVKSGGPWTERMVHQFDGQDGSNSSAGVIFDGNGNLYGTTSGGPAHGFGLVFKLQKPFGKLHSWTESVLHDFSDRNDGEEPMAGLVFDSTGRLYGTALGGGTHRGVVFRLAPPKHGNPWALTVLYNLQGAPNADHPTVTLIFDNKGNLYSTTEWGGTGQACQGGCGTVFEVSP